MDDTSSPQSSAPTSLSLGAVFGLVLLTNFPTSLLHVLLAVAFFALLQTRLSIVHILVSSDVQ
eukprot:636971-Prorocentrum_lima.AAC.1